MSKCTNNPNLARIACTDEFNGELQHCVARVPWSTHPDGRAHVTAARSVIDAMWRKGGDGGPANPATLGFVQDERGRWREPASEGFTYATTEAAA